MTRTLSITLSLLLASTCAAHAGFVWRSADQASSSGQTTVYEHQAEPTHAQNAQSAGRTWHEVPSVSYVEEKSVAATRFNMSDPPVADEKVYNNSAFPTVSPEEEGMSREGAGQSSAQEAVMPSWSSENPTMMESIAQDDTQVPASVQAMNTMQSHDNQHAEPDHSDPEGPMALGPVPGATTRAVLRDETVTSNPGLLNPPQTAAASSLDQSEVHHHSSQPSQTSIVQTRTPVSGPVSSAQPAKPGAEAALANNTVMSAPAFSKGDRPLGGAAQAPDMTPVNRVRTASPARIRPAMASPQQTAVTLQPVPPVADEDAPVSLITGRVLTPSQPTQPQHGTAHSQASFAVPSVPDAGVVQGFGKQVPLIVALRQILPAGYSFAHSDGVDLSSLVSWSGGRPWPEVLHATLLPLGLRATITADTVMIDRGVQQAAASF